MPLILVLAPPALWTYFYCGYCCGGYDMDCNDDGCTKVLCFCCPIFYFAGLAIAFGLGAIFCACLVVPAVLI